MNIYTPIKRKFKTDDAFFAEGNLESRAFWLRKHISVRKGFGREELRNIIREECEKVGLVYNPISCHLPPWCQRNPITFPTPTAYEIHYNTSHRHTCQECNVVFPSQRWLDLHLEEFHSKLLEIRRERGEKVFRCFVEGCKKSFIDPFKRRQHMFGKHKYPKAFSFGIIKFGVVPFSIRQAELRKRKKYAEKLVQKQSTSPLHETTASREHVSKYSLDTPEPDSISIETEPPEIEMLTTQMSNLSLPKGIKFGRGHQRMRLSFGGRGRAKPTFGRSAKSSNRKSSLGRNSVEMEGVVAGKSEDEV